MLSRIFTLAIVLFWLGSIGWLCAVVWAPPESRMAEVDPREIYEAFFSWNESTNMTLLENGSRRGEVRVTGSSGDDVRTGEFSNSISVTGSIDAIDPVEDFPGPDLTWRSLLEFDREMAFFSGDFSVRVPRLQLTAHMALEGVPPVTKASVSMGDIPLFQFDSSKTELNAGSLEALPLGSLLGSSIPLATVFRDGELDPSLAELEIDARMGTFPVGGRNLRAYLLKVGSPNREESVRIFFSEAGEPLRIETNFGFEAISEILMPLDAYLEKNENDSDD